MLVALAGEKPRGTTPEGLSPIETGKKRHQHGVAAHEQTEGSNGHGEADSRNSRMVQIGEAVLLALVTVTAAWAVLSDTLEYSIAGRDRPILDAAQHRHPL